MLYRYCFCLATSCQRFLIALLIGQKGLLHQLLPVPFLFQTRFPVLMTGALDVTTNNAQFKRQLGVAGCADKLPRICR